MSLKSDILRLQRVLELIHDSGEIIQKHGTLEAAISDKEGEYALMMILTQIGERLGKVETPEFLATLPVREAMALRNVIVHDYEGINKNRIRLVFEQSLPQLRRAIESIAPEIPAEPTRQGSGYVPEKPRPGR